MIGNNNLYVLPTCLVWIFFHDHLVNTLWDKSKSFTTPGVAILWQGSSIPGKKTNTSMILSFLPPTHLATVTLFLPPCLPPSFLPPSTLPTLPPSLFLSFFLPSLPNLYSVLNGVSYRYELTDAVPVCSHMDTSISRLHCLQQLLVETEHLVCVCVLEV